MDVYSQATIIYDDASVRDVLANEVDAELEKVAETLDYAMNVTYSPLGFQSHPVSFATYAEPYIGGCMDLARERGVPVLSMDEGLEYALVPVELSSAGDSKRVRVQFAGK